MKLNQIIKFFRYHIFLDKYEKEYVKQNKLKWKKKKKIEKKIILVDLFPWYPYIHIWSYLSNIISLKKNSQIKFFYFDLNFKRKLKSRLYISKLVKIYKSFNCTEGITDYEIINSQTEKDRYRSIFKNFKNNKSKLIKFRRNNIQIGDLIYDTYLLIYKKPTANFNDENLFNLFVKGNQIFDICNNYFKKNKIECVIPSHVCYSSYGIISRLALSRNIPVFKIKSENWGKALFRLIKIDKKHSVDEHPYYNYKKIFFKFDNSKKNKARKIGKKLILNRLSGKKDSNIPYLKLSSYNKKNKLRNFDGLKKEKSVVIFPHSLNDNPHRFRSMLFPDFYEQVLFILKNSEDFKKINWYYKPHPNETKEMLIHHKKITKKFSNVIILNQNISNKFLLELKPKFIITNHGTIAHEFAYMNIPAICTGDNPHINYDFCFTPKNRKELKNTINKFIKRKIDFKINKNQIYEFMYLHYEYFPNLFNRKKLISDNYFSFTKFNIKFFSDPLKLYLKETKKVNNNIQSYINNFVEFNLNDRKNFK